MKRPILTALLLILIVLICSFGLKEYQYVFIVIAIPVIVLWVFVRHAITEGEEIVRIMDEIIDFNSNQEP